MGGWDPQADPESPLGDQTCSSQLGLKVSRRLSDIFKEGSGGWGKENRSGRGTFGAQGGGGVLEGTTRAGSPPAAQRHNSFRLHQQNRQAPPPRSHALVAYVGGAKI